MKVQSTMARSATLTDALEKAKAEAAGVMKEIMVEQRATRTLVATIDLIRRDLSRERQADLLVDLTYAAMPLILTALLQQFHSSKVRTSVVGVMQRQIVELAEQYGVDATGKLQDDSAKEST